ncbi:MAG: hypothetical protein IID08_10535 [Candidatus Hydrogenedentes bacterium]|nr:hypothetical protein [Candidatus Hydrogenedentota bacterium]
MEFKDDEHGVIVYINDLMPTISISSILSNTITFGCPFTASSNGRIFSLDSRDFYVRLEIQDGMVSLRRNNFEAKQDIRAAKEQFHVLGGWKPDQFQLVAMLDGDVGLDSDVVNVNTSPIYVPTRLLTWARRTSLLPQQQYSSVADFVRKIVEAIRQAQATIMRVGSHSQFWDFPRSGDDRNFPVPKSEPQAMKGVAALLQDQAALGDFELSTELNAGTGSLDMLATASLAGGGLVKIAIEAKNAHAGNINHGIEHQLPSYMYSKGADFGIYLVLWYKCQQYDEPKEGSTDLKLGLTKLRHLENMTVEILDLSLPVSPSRTNFVIH